MSPNGLQLSTQPPAGTIKEVFLMSKLGVAIGLFAYTIQQYLTHFVDNTRLMLKHYEPPTTFNEAKIFVQ